MPTGRLILLLLLIVVAAVAVVLVLRRGSARRDEQRAEAAGIRGEAEGIAATMTGQDTFAQQSAERAEVARQEAEERAREAARLEAEAAEQRAAAEATRREYEATMRRADDVDPDVKESAFAPLPESAPTTTSETTTDAGVPATSDADATADAGTDVTPDAGRDDVPLSRAERRRALEDEAAPVGTAPAGPGAVAAGAAAAGAAGAATWASRHEEDSSPESQRIASAADYRDEVPAGDAEAGSSTDVYQPVATGSGAGMSQDSRTGDDTADLAKDTESPSGEWGGPRTDADAPGAAETSATDGGADDSGADAGADGTAGLAIVADTDAYAATEPVPAAEQTPPIERVAPASADTDEHPLSGDDHDRTTDEEAAADLDETHDPVSTSESGEDADDADDAEPRRDEGAADTHIVSDTDAYASTEPLQASDAEPAPDLAEDADARRGDTDSDADHTAADDEHAPAEAGAAVAEPSEADTDRTASDVAEEPAQERYDPTPTRDWAADEGDLLAENRELGDRLADDRDDLRAEGDRLTGVAAREGASAPATDTAASDPDGTAPDTRASASTVADDAASTDADDSVDQALGRRVSEFHELRDGGYGVGSAAPLEDGAQPLDHAVQGYRDTMTFRSPGDAGYDSAEPDVWFYDEAAAERSGFRRSGD